MKTKNYSLIEVDMPWVEQPEERWPYHFDSIWIIYSLEKDAVVSYPKKFYVDQTEGWTAMAQLQRDDDRLKLLDD